MAFAPAATAQDLIEDGCVGKDGAAKACAATTSTGACASVSFGLQGAYACEGRGGGKVCTSMQGPFQCIYTVHP